MWIKEDKGSVGKRVIHNLAHVLHGNQVTLDAFELTWSELFHLVEVCLAFNLLLQLLVAGLVEIHILRVLIEILSVVETLVKVGEGLRDLCQVGTILPHFVKAHREVIPLLFFDNQVLLLELFFPLLRNLYDFIEEFIYFSEHTLFGLVNQREFCFYLALFLLNFPR